MNTLEQELRQMNQADRVARMHKEVKRQGGEVVGDERLPIEIEEELLRKALGFSKPFFIN